MLIEVMDTTLRDGEQRPGGRFSPEQKLAIAQFLLEKVGVSRVEVTSARSSPGEFRALSQIMIWAQENSHQNKIEILSFVDGDKSVQWAQKAGCQNLNLLAKGSEKHCRIQLRKDIEGHLEDIMETISAAVNKGIVINVYLEDWSNGMFHSPDYVKKLISEISISPIARIILCDTLGILNPWQVEELIGLSRSYCETDVPFDFHGHNDYGLATANSLAALRAGVSGVHVTVNGLGERAGNAALEEVVVGIKDHLKSLAIEINEDQLRPLSRLVSIFSGRRISPNKPIIGNAVFANTAGIHADGDRKGLLYVSELSAERFGATLEHSLGKLAGRASVKNNLDRLGFNLDDEQVAQVLERVIKLGDKGKPVTIADLPYIVSEILSQPEMICFEVLSVSTHSQTGQRATISAKISFRGKECELPPSHGDGSFDAFMNALRKWSKRFRKNKVFIPQLIDYDPVIPPGGTSGALVEAIITWKGPRNIGEFQTVGVDPDQVMASIKAAEMAMNVCNQNSH